MKNRKTLVGFCFVFISLIAGSLAASAQNGKAKFVLFGDQLSSQAHLEQEDQYVRTGGYLGDKDTKYIYIKPSTSPARITGLSIPIRENPGPGEYRYVSFAWVKWAGEQIGLRMTPKKATQQGRKYNYTYYAGEGDSIKVGYKVADKAAGNWVVITRDLWKDFGNFTLSELSLLCPYQRDAGFDAIIFGQSQDSFDAAPQVLPAQIAASVNIDEDGNIILDDIEEVPEESSKVEIDWAAQIQAGGFMMYPLYLLGLITIVIALQRALTSREGRLAPKKLRSEVHDCLMRGDITGAIKACDKYPSTLGESLRFIFMHKNAGKEAVSQTAGDIAARDIRTHLSRIYPLSVISSLSPLLGLLGTIVGMIEAFGLVALYGDEGGAAILSDSISKALITTAAGLIIAVPAVAVYFILKNRIMRLASLVEVEIEGVLTDLYLKEDVPSTNKEN